MKNEYIDPFGEEDWDEGKPFDKYYIFRGRNSYMSSPNVYIAKCKTRFEVFTLSIFKKYWDHPKFTEMFKFNCDNNKGSIRDLRQMEIIPFNERDIERIVKGNIEIVPLGYWTDRMSYEKAKDMFDIDDDDIIFIDNKKYKGLTLNENWEIKKLSDFL